MPEPGTTTARDRRDERRGQVVVIGNLQSGKSTIFRGLCGKRSGEQFPGHSSRQLTRGSIRPAPAGLLRRALGRILAPAAGGRVIVDTPGTATLFDQDVDGMLAGEALLEPDTDAILVVADAKSTRRGIALAAHAAEYGLPMVLAVNMIDEAGARGIDIDYGLLESRLGVEVVPTAADQGVGLDRLVEALGRARTPTRQAGFSARLSERLERLERLLEPLPLARAQSLSLAAGDPRVATRLAAVAGDERAAEALAVAREIERDSELPADVLLSEVFLAAGARLAGEASSQREAGRRWLQAFGRWAHHPVLGLLIAALVVLAMFYWVGALGATLVVDTLEQHLFEQRLLPLMRRGTDALPWPLAAEALMDPDFGLVTNGLVLAFGLVLPVLFFFYLGFNVLLESGYLPRISVLLDRVFRRVGLNGRGILPLALGLSCVTMALISTRMLKTGKERTIASLLLVLGIPCAPLLAVMLLVLAEMPVAAALTVFGVIGAQILLAGLLAERLLPGAVSDFIMELPPMRVPRPGRVLRQTARQSWEFMKEALPLFLLASLALFSAARAGLLEVLERAARPLMGGLLGLPEQSVQVFIKTMIRRESGIAELEQVRAVFDNVQVVVTLVVMTLLTPCVNASLVLIKERGLGRALVMLAVVSVWALLVGTAVNAACRWLGVSFT